MSNSGPDSLLNEDLIANAVVQVVADFGKLLQKQSQSFSQCTVFLLKGNDVTRRNENKRSRDFLYFIGLFYDRWRAGHFSRKDAENLVQDYFGNHALFVLKRASDIEDIRRFASESLREGSITINFWFGKVDVWLLAGQKS